MPHAADPNCHLDARAPAAVTAPSAVPQTHELVLTPSCGILRTLNLEAYDGRIFAWVAIGEGVMVSWANADCEQVRTRTGTDGLSNIWLDGAAFSLTDSELPRVEAWLAAVRAAS